MTDKVFIDSDVILDVALDRKPFSSSAALVLSLCEAGGIEGYTSSIVFTNLYYILRKISGHSAAIIFLGKLIRIVSVLGVDESTIVDALAADFADFKDAVQYCSSARNGMGAILTRNTPDYEKSDLPVYTPREFLELRKNS